MKKNRKSLIKQEVKIPKRDNDEAIDALEGCRSGANTIKPDRNRTGGIFIISTLSGFIIELKEYIHRETPTEVTSDAVNAFTLLQSHRNYFERLESIGYDNMCNLQKKIHKSGKNGELSEMEAFFWTELLYRTFVDSFHIAKHKCPLCDIKHEAGICCFNTKLPKFKDIFTEYVYNTYEKSKRFLFTKVKDEVETYLYHIL